MEKTFELEAQYSHTKSHYKKAHVREYTNGDMDLISYSTKVATIRKGKLEVLGLYSNTTKRHLHDFINQFSSEWVSGPIKKELEQFMN